MYADGFDSETERNVVSPQSVHEDQGSGRTTPVTKKPDEGGALMGDQFFTPPHRQQRRGIWTNGEPNVQHPLRESESGTNSLRARNCCVARLTLKSASLSISDGDIIGCNNRFWKVIDNAESFDLWELGKHIGTTCFRDEDEVIKEVERMEERDVAIMTKNEKGNKTGLI